VRGLGGAPGRHLRRGVDDRASSTVELIVLYRPFGGGGVYPLAIYGGFIRLGVYGGFIRLGVYGGFIRLRFATPSRLPSPGSVMGVMPFHSSEVLTA